MQSFDQFLAVLSEVPDPRRAEGKIYKLPYVLLFSILAVVTGGNSFRSIETFIKVHRRRLNTPSVRAGSVRPPIPPFAISSRASTHRLSSGCSAATPLVCGMPQPIQRGADIALDGKTLRRSFDKFNDRKAAQLLHAFDVEAGLVLAHVDIEEKSDEIPPHSSYSANSRSRTASSRSMPCTVKKTFEAAAQAQARLIVQLKDNQPTRCKMSKPPALPADLPAATPLSPPGTAGMKPEPPTYSAPHAPLPEPSGSLSIETIVRVTRRCPASRCQDGTMEQHSRDSILPGQLPVSACHAATAVRCHWHVENALHYTRDVTFQEDQSRIRHKPGVFARLRSFAYNILRRNRS